MSDDNTESTRKAVSHAWRKSSRKRKFIEALQQRGVVLHACQESGVSRSSAYRWYEEDEGFALAWEDAIELSNDTIESEMYRRAVEGRDRVLITEGQGSKGNAYSQRQTWVKETSDSLLKFIAQSRKPERFREQHQVSHEHKVAVWDFPDTGEAAA